MREKLAKILYGLSLMLLGAIMLTLFLQFVRIPASPGMPEVRQSLFFLVSTMLLVHSGVSQSHKSSGLTGPRPAKFVTGMVLASGTGAALFIGMNTNLRTDAWLPATIMVLTLAVAISVYRFSDQDAGNIGEMRTRL